MLKAYLTRDSVCAGDDVDAPHAREVELPSEVTFDRVVLQIAEAAQLPRIAGGLATWVLVSNRPLAVIAQQWDEPRLLRCASREDPELDERGQSVRFHFNYLAQEDPETVYRILSRLQIRAE